MPRISPLRSGAFRFALMVAAIFALGTVILFFTVEGGVTRYATEVARDAVSTEVAVLVDEDRTAQPAQMIQSVVRREHAVREHELRYLLVDRSGKRLAGSLPERVARVGWRQIRLENRDGEIDDDPGTVSLMALGARLSDGGIVVVGSDASDLSELRQGLGMAAALFGGAITLLALIGGFAVGTVFLRRLDGVNRSVEEIMEGRLTQRLPAIGMSPEFDHLSANLNRMLDRIEALMEGLRQVSTDIAHDLRTPLTRLRQRLEDMKGGAGALDEQVDAALAQTDQILAVFRTLLRISAFEAGAGRQRMGEVNLSEMVERTFLAYRPVAEDAGDSLTAQIEPGISCRGDGDMLTQAVTNLIENALLHAPRGSRVTMSLARRARGAVITVADNGPGIPEAERKKVLQRFYRLDTSRGTPGAGLGLALVSAIAAIHDAQLTLTENGPGLRVEMTIADLHPTGV